MPMVHRHMALLQVREALFWVELAGRNENITHRYWLPEELLGC